MSFRTVTDYEKDRQLIKEICYSCGSRSVKESFAYLRRARYQGGQRFFCDIFDEVGCFTGVIAKDHIRMIVIAVIQTEQKNGIGRKIIKAEKLKALVRGIHRITFRTAQDETAVKFHMKLGARIIGKKGKDWEMELRF